MLWFCILSKFLIHRFDPKEVSDEKKNVQQSIRIWILCQTWVLEIIRRCFQRAIGDSFYEIKRCSYVQRLLPPAWRAFSVSKRNFWSTLEPPDSVPEYWNFDFSSDLIGSCSYCTARANKVATSCSEPLSNHRWKSSKKHVFHAIFDPRGATLELFFDGFPMSNVKTELLNRKRINFYIGLCGVTFFSDPNSRWETVFWKSTQKGVTIYRIRTKTIANRPPSFPNELYSSSF